MAITDLELAKLIENGDVSITVDPSGTDVHVYLTTDVVTESTPSSYLGTEIRSDEVIYQRIGELLESGKLEIDENDGVIVNLDGELVYTQYLSFTE